jgi:hypothetical protein
MSYPNYRATESGRSLYMILHLDGHVPHIFVSLTAQGVVWRSGIVLKDDRAEVGENTPC